FAAAGVAAVGVLVPSVVEGQATSNTMTAKEKANLQHVRNWWLECLEGRNLEATSKYQADSYIQHNINFPTGRAGFMKIFVDLFSRIRKPEPLQAGWKNKPTLMFASGPYVFLIVKRAEKDPDDPSQTYPAYWFDMVRVDKGMIQEHWDAAVKNPPAPGRGAN